ncbi:MAG TPA: glycosyltransferase, partial [Flavobacterium sp.]|nr:glycosyltransferase [Flavobacterium sp.]
MLLSIIVPVYNVENYLRRCLNSLLDQDLCLDDYEIIIVNDGSTDSSLRIAQEYGNKFSSIKIISQENQGLSEARNVGIRNALGQYIYFIDSDDFIQKKIFNSIFKIVK